VIEWLLRHEAPFRFASFIAVFAIMALWEATAPRRAWSVSKARRWPRNLALTGLNTLLIRFVFPSAAVGMALLASERAWGVFNNVVTPLWLSFAASVLVLDLAVYLQHVLFHAVPALWRLHMVHHADLDFDVTTGTRFHPVEMLLSMLLKIAVVALLGAPAAAVLFFEVILNATSLFNHSNVWISLGVDRWLRLLVVTPDMHRVHHSVLAGETNSNFGFNFPWWDRLFKSYRASPSEGHQGMVIGLKQFRGPEPSSLTWILKAPFVSETGGYAFGLSWPRV
jgi:sterol desaturase/sphingolipid hydroxylase (fatty acid hydroxylase superfamily)